MKLGKLLSNQAASQVSAKTNAMLAERTCPPRAAIQKICLALAVESDNVQVIRAAIKVCRPENGAR